jgi:hypothetical protein
MSGWRARLEKGEPLFATFQKQVASVVNYLVRQGTVDPSEWESAASRAAVLLRFTSERPILG